MKISQAILEREFSQAQTMLSKYRYRHSSESVQEISSGW